MTSFDDDIPKIIQGCIKNDRHAQELLYKRFYSAMASICLRYTRNQEDAIEALHNGFLKVYKNIHLYNLHKASLYTWIRGIIINAAIDFLRRKEKFTWKAGSDQTEEIAIDAEVIQRLSVQELLQLIQQLPAATKAVFNLYVVEGYNHREIGELLNISEGTSKWHLSDARKRLQQLLQTIYI